jgi:hypothetical protein
MVNLRLRRAGLPIAISAVVAAVAVTGAVIANGTAGAETAARPDRGAVALQQAAAGARKHAVPKPATKPRSSAALAATDERKFGDLTGDGKADLAAIDSNGVMWVYPGRQYRWDGTGTRSTALFSPRIQVGKGWGVFTSLVRHGDINGDGRQDVLVRDSQGRLFLYAGTGDPAGMFRPGIQVGSGWGTFTSITGAGDLNTDGKDDLLGQKSNGELLLYPGTGDAVTPFTRGRLIGTGWRGGLLTAIGDWTYDDRTEFMFRNTLGYVRNYESQTGEFPIGKPEIVLEPEAGNFLINMVGMGDLTSDLDFEPIPDVLMQGKDGSLVLYTWDWAPASSEATKIGSGWANYRIF